MKPAKIKFLFLLIISFFIISSFYVWDKIYLPLSENAIQNFTGTVYIKNNYNHLNEILRFLYTIFLPSFLLFFYLVLTKNCILSFKKTLKFSSSFNKKRSLKIFFIISFFFILNFLFSNPATHSLDTLHEGMRLTAWENLNFYDSFWKSSFITVGWGQEFLIPILSELIYGEVTINRTRLILFFYKFLNQILLLTLVYQIISQQKFEKKINDILFLLFSTIVLFISNFNDSIVSHREIPILIFFISLWNIINNKKIYVYLIIVGSLSCLSLIWSLDRGIFLNMLLIVLLIFFILNKNYRYFAFLILSIFLAWIIVYLSFGHDEFLHFVSNSIWIFSNIENIYGLIHPTPFGDQMDSSRSGKNIIVLIITSLLSIYFGLSKKSKLENSNKILLIFFFIISVLSYKTALGRSDGPHLKTAMFFSYITLAFIMFINLGYYLEKRFYQNKSLKTFKYISYLFLISFVIKFIIFDNKIYQNNFQIVLFKNYKNEFYIDEKKLKLYKQIYNEIENKKCINNFSYDSSLPYLISKPSCNKYYFIYSLGGEKIQKDYINYLKNSDDQIIILKKNERYIDNSPEEILPILFEYINKNYNIHNEFDNYIILESKT